MAGVATVVALALVAVNLRPGLASVGPVLGELRADLALPGAALALLTTLPVLCLGLLAPLAPVTARRWGLERALLVALVLLAAGLTVRVLGGAELLFVGTVLAAGAIAVTNVLVPTLIKRDAGARTNTLMGVYTMCLTGSAAVAAGTTVPLAQLTGLGWRGGLGCWAVLAAVAALAWSPLAYRSAGRSPDQGSVRSGGLLGQALAWQVTLFFGLQSLTFYVTLAWLPTVYRDAGASPGHAGLLLSLSTLVQVPVSLLVPQLVRRAPDQRGLVAAAALLTGLGYFGILAAPDALSGKAAYLWVVLLGIGQGMSFAVALLLTVLRARASGETAQLSAMAQSVGYTIAATGPFAFGALHERTGSWTPSLVLILLLLVPQVGFGLPAARRRYLSSTA